MNKSRPRREHLLEVAHKLFSANGYHHTGIDTIVKHSGVSKTTMYKYFETKDELVLEVLKRRHLAISINMDSCIDKSREIHPDFPEHRHIDAIFDATENWIRSREFNGCDFINATAEYADKKNPVHKFAALHKRSVRNRIKKLLCGYSRSNAADMARQIAVALDGAIVNAQVLDDKSAVDVVRSITETLFESTPLEN